MNDLINQVITEIQYRGCSSNTKQSYTVTLICMAKFFGRTIDEVSCYELNTDFQHRSVGRLSYASLALQINNQNQINQLLVKLVELFIYNTIINQIVSLIKVFKNKSIIAAQGQTFRPDLSCLQQVLNLLGLAIFADLVRLERQPKVVKYFTSRKRLGRLGCKNLFFFL